MVGFLLEQDAVEGRRNALDSWIDEQKRNAERAAQQAQQAAQATVQHVQQAPDEVAQRAQKFQDWVSQQQQQPTAPAEPAASSLLSPPPAPPVVGEPASDVAARARQFQDWITQQTQPQPAPAPAATPTPQPALPPSEEPATATDNLGGKWKTSFDHGATYTGSYRTGTPHRGIDLVPADGKGIGTGVEAFAPGTVTGIHRDSGAGGLMVYVQDDQGLTHAYMHLAGTAPGLQVGQKIGRGQRIAIMGESGTEGSPHLHYEVRKNAATGDPLDQLIDPRPYIGGQQQPAAGTALPPSRFNPAGKTTAEISGGGPSGAMTDRAQSIMSEAGQAAQAFGGDAARAVQAVLVTEGGMNNARGDSGASAGPLQFFGEAGGRAGQLNNFARDLGVPLEDARKWIEENPVAAVKWALGTPDLPGYLGRALIDGIQKGLQGSALAEHIQRVGQVSVSPERAAANYQNLFGQGQEVIRRAGASAVDAALEAGRQVEGRAGDLVREGQQLAQQGQDRWSELQRMQEQARAEGDRWFSEQRARGEEWDARRQRQDLDWQRSISDQMAEFQRGAEGVMEGFRAPLSDAAQGAGRFFEGLGTDVRRQQAEAQERNPYMAGVAGRGFGDPGTALTAGLERAGVPSPYREILGGGSQFVLPSGAARTAAGGVAREAVEQVAERPDLVRRLAQLVTVEGPDAIRNVLSAPELQQVLRSRAGPDVARELAEGVPVGPAAAAGEDVLEKVIGPDDIGRRVADVVRSRQPAQASALGVVRGSGALAGGVAGWQSTPEEAGPLERGLRTLGGVGVGLAVPSVTEAALTRPQLRQTMLESLRRGGITQGPSQAVPGPGVNVGTVVDLTKQAMLTDPVSRGMDMIGSIVELLRQPISLTMGGQGPEAGAGLAAVGRALPEAFDNARQALLGRQVATLGQQAQDIGKSKPIFRLLAAGDTFTRTLGEYQGMAARGVRMLKDAGIPLNTPQAEQYLAQHADQLYREGAKSGTGSVFGSALQGQGASVLDRWMTSFSNYKQTLLNSDSKVDQAFGALFDQQIPFTGVPSRVLQIGLERVPGITQTVGAARIARALQKEDTFAAQKALGEVATESLIQAFIAQGIREGNITGPDDPEHPNSVQVNGEWIPMRTFSVYALPMGIMAAWAESIEKTGREPDQTELERVAAALNASIEPLMDAVPGFSFVKMLASLGRGGGTGAFTDVASDFLGRLTPAALAKIENMVDPYVREVSTRGFEALWEPSVARIPGVAARFLPPKIDPTTGEPMQRGVTPLGGIDKPSSPVRAELARLKREGYDLNPPPDKPSSITVRGVSVPVREGSPEQRAMVAARGKFLAEVSSQMTKPSYAKMNDKQKALFWASMINRSETRLARAWTSAVDPKQAAVILARGRRVVGRLQDVEDEDELINRQVAITSQLRRQQERSA